MITISKDEVKIQLRSWGIRQLDNLEEAIGRELTEEQYKDFIFYLMGYADFSQAQSLESFVDFLYLTDTFSEAEMKAIKEYDGQEEV